MSLFQPTQIIPSTLTQTGTVDVTQPLKVGWQVNGNSPMTAYQIKIFRNDTDSTELYSTGKVTLATPFNGKTNLGEVQYFEAESISQETLYDAGIVNGYSNGYKIVITQWWSETAYVTQSSASLFITRTTPTLSLSVPAVVDSKSYSFTAEYTQEQGDTLDWVHWYIANNSNLDEPLLDTGDIYGTTILQIGYDGFFSGERYSVRCVVQTENGVQVDTGWKNFSVSYLSRVIDGIVSVCRPLNANYISVSWSALNSIIGDANGSYEIVDGKLILPSGSVVTWNEVNSEEMSYLNPWTFVWKGKPNDLDTPMWEIVHNGVALQFHVTANGMSLTNGSDTIYTQALQGSPYCWFTTIVTPGGIFVQRIAEAGGLYPSESLFPSDTVYPKESSDFNVELYSSEITLPQGIVSAINLYGSQICEYVWMEGGILSQDLIDSIMQSTSYEPTLGDATYMMADFENGLSAGNMDATGYSIYRKESNSDILFKLADVDTSVQQIWDFGAASQSTYQYYVFVIGSTTYLNEPLVSEEITPVFWDWCLLDCELLDDGAYHVQREYPFRVNLDTSATSNNNTPNLLANFTRYPVRQGVSSNYRSGTLSAFAGIVDHYKNAYIEADGLIEDIYALSQSNTPKFLKNRRGDIFRVETSAPITMQTGDKYREQPQKVSLPWVEVGDASSLPIIATTGDAVWLSDKILETTVSISFPDGNLLWFKPDGYTNGSVLSMDSSGNLMQYTDGAFDAAQLEINTSKELVAYI